MRELRSLPRMSSTFLNSPDFHEFLLRYNYIEEIYDALAKDDTSEVVMSALHIMKKTNNLPPIVTSHKNKEKSASKRSEGNNAYLNDNYQRALAMYNAALVHAPIGSTEMKLALSNRSALFLKLKAWIACNSDISRIFALGCPIDIKDKLVKRQKEARQFIMMENLSINIMSTAGENFIGRDSMKCNAQIPCTSSDIKFVTSAVMPQVIAATNIKVGAVLASEQAYVSHSVHINSMVSCYFCQRKALNLIPCEDCCYALFCNDECKNKCKNEYHDYECKIMDILMQPCILQIQHLMVKACLKLQKSCKSWDEFITASHKMGCSRINASSFQEIYDTNNKYSVLCCKDSKTFIYGALYNNCFIVAIILHYLEDMIPLFLPSDAMKKLQAMQALARIMMFLFVYQKPFTIVQGQNNIKLDRSSYAVENYGLFSFISKLKNSCNPNSIIINNNNILVLISQRLIQAGEELTVPFILQGSSLEKQQQDFKRVKLWGTICSCHRCIKNSSQIENDKELLSQYQRKYFSQLDLNAIGLNLKNLEVNRIYETLLEALTVLNNVPNSEEYIMIYKLWRRCLFFYEVVSSKNDILDN